MKLRRTDRGQAAALGGRRLRLCLALMVMLALTAGSAASLWNSQERNQGQIEQRFVARTDLAADFVATYAEQLMQREHDAALATLAASGESFDAVVASFGFPAALLIDDRRRVLAVAPSKPDIIGTDLVGRYPHLQTALAGQRAVSPVVPSAATGEPIVAFAVPFETLSGRRVFSGAYALRRTPLKSYLDALTSLPGAHVYLVDQAGEILTNAGPIDQIGQLSAVQPQVASAAPHRAAGVAGESFFVVSPVAGTPWRVITTVPTSALLAPVQGPARYVPWIVLVLLVGTAFGICALMYRLLQNRDHLSVANERLDTLARTDVLTGVRNRRATTTEAARLFDRMQRERQALAVLMIDVDHFKRVNDTFGHAAGDAVLIEVATRLRCTLRTHDIIGRWGGEEFVVLLPNTDHTAAAAIANRLRSAVAEVTIAAGSGGDDITVTVSVGSASSLKSGPEVLFAAADRALYLAKNEGRNLVRTAAC